MCKWPTWLQVPFSSDKSLFISASAVPDHFNPVSSGFLFNFVFYTLLYFCNLFVLALFHIQIAGSPNFCTFIFSLFLPGLFQAFLIKFVLWFYIDIAFCTFFLLKTFLLFYFYIFFIYFLYLPAVFQTISIQLAEQNSRLLYFPQCWI